MATFNFSNYGVFLVRLYKKVGDESNRLMEDLDYYLMNTKEKTKYLYHVCPNKFDIYLIYKKYDTMWDFENLNLIVSNVLKESRYMFICINGYQGLMTSDFWEELKECVKYFDNVNKFRKELKKKESEELLDVVEETTITLTIDDVLNKINESGIKSLTEEEEKILKNHNDE